MEAGKYRANAVGCAFGRASTGTEQMGVAFEVRAGESKEYITWYGYFSEATMERTIKTLRTLGWQGNDLYKIAEDGSDFPNEVELDIQRDDKGNLKVAWVNRIGAGVAMKDVMSPAEKMAFSERMKGLCMSIKADTPVKKKEGAAAAPKAAAPGGVDWSKRTAGEGQSKPKFGNDFPTDDDPIPF